jgi:hypothetical protein
MAKIMAKILGRESRVPANVNGSTTILFYQGVNAMYANYFWQFSPISGTNIGVFLNNRLFA